MDLAVCLASLFFNLWLNVNLETLKFVVFRGFLVKISADECFHLAFAADLKRALGTRVVFVFLHLLRTDVTISVALLGRIYLDLVTLRAANKMGI